MILKYAYDGNPIGSNGLSILHTAAKRGQYEIFQFFFEHVKENPKDSNDVTLTSGTFNIRNHFFSTGEELEYTPILRHREKILVVLISFSYLSECL